MGALLFDKEGYIVQPEHEALKLALRWDSNSMHKVRAIEEIERLERKTQDQASEINKLRNVIQAACNSGTDGMTLRWKQLFPDAPVPMVKASGWKVPSDYALVHIDALKSWGKYDDLVAMCVHPTQGDTK